MDLELLKNYCLSKKGAREDYPFDEKTLVFKAGSKMFCLTNIYNKALSINLKCDPDLSLSLRADYPAVSPGFHMNKEYWNTITLDGTLDDDKIKWLIDLSYDLVVKGMRKKEREKL